MSEENKGVETPVEVAPAQQEVDYEAKIASLDAELAKERTEKENYRRGMLKAKGKLPEEDTNNLPEDWREEARRIALEVNSSSRETRLQAERDDLMKAALKRNKELELALKNRGQITSVSAPGSNQERPEVKTDSYFSPEQVQSLKAKGWDDKKIEAAKKNMLRGSDLKP